MKLMRGDCLELMKEIPDGSVDMILADPPYGRTNCEWDSVIPLEPMWREYNRIIKTNGAIVLFSQQPFETDLIQSNRKFFRYEIIWNKNSTTGFLLANKMPLKKHENIVVFYKKLPTYNPQKTHGKPYGNKRRTGYDSQGVYKGTQLIHKTNETGDRFPTSIIDFSNFNRNDRFHPTQKPTALLEYLIRTYTNQGEVVLDNCMGSGSTGVACVNTGRDFIGIEKDDKYFEVAEERIRKAEEERQLAYMD